MTLDLVKVEATNLVSGLDFPALYDAVRPSS